jgi:hypothetical protein
MFDAQLFLALALGKCSPDLRHLRRQATGDALLESVHETRCVRQRVSEPAHRLFTRRSLDQPFEQQLEIARRIRSDGGAGVWKYPSGRDSANQLRRAQQFNSPHTPEVNRSQVDIDFARGPAQWR